MIRRLVVIVVLAMAALATSVQVAGADSIADHVVISEVQIATDEFVELYNPTNGDIDMTGWHWCYFSGKRDWDNPYRDRIFPSGATISARGFYLVATKSGDFSTADWNLGYADHFLSGTAGCIGIFPWDPDTKTSEKAKAGRIDAVAWGSVSYVKEGTEASFPNSGESLQRKVSYTVNDDGLHGPTWDSDDNSADFFVQDSPNPTNSAAGSANPVYPIPEFTTSTLFLSCLITIASYL